MQTNEPLAEWSLVPRRLVRLVLGLSATGLACGGRSGLPEVDPPCTDDADADGFLSEACGGDDCDDRDSEVHPGPPEPSRWVTEYVDEVSNAGESCALALDAEGHAHIHYSHGDVEFRYATNRGGDWALETIEPGGGNTQQSSIVVDSTGEARVAYAHVARDEGRRESLRYARRIAGAWEIETLEDRDVSNNAGVALALDHTDAAHVTYSLREGGAAGVRYATNARGPWEIEQVASGERTGGASLALDEDGRPQVAYVAGMDPIGQVFVADRDDRGWRSEAIAEMGALPPLVIYSVWDRCCTSLLRLPDGELHVSYPSAGLGYATNESGLWRSEEIQVDPYDKGQHTSMARDRHGRLHVVWIAFATRRPDPYALAYARGGPGDWSAEIVDEFAMSGPSDASLALDAAGGVHIAYVGADSGLYYASRAPDPRRCE